MDTQIIILSAALISIGIPIGSHFNILCLFDFEQGSEISFPPTNVSHPSFSSTEVSLPFHDFMQALLDSHNSGHIKSIFALAVASSQTILILTVAEQMQNALIVKQWRGIDVFVPLLGVVHGGQGEESICLLKGELPLFVLFTLDHRSKWRKC